MARGEVHRRWRERNPDKLLTYRQKAKAKREAREGPTAPQGGCWCVIALLDESARVRWVEPAHRARESPWKMIWRYRHNITSPLADWLCTLSCEPTERIVIGSVIGLSGKEAVRLCRGLVRGLEADLNRPAGLPGRPVIKIDGKALTFYASETEAGRANDVTQEAVWLARSLGKGYFDGAARRRAVL